MDSEVERGEQEEALVALIEHRTKEVHHLRNRISYYQLQLEESEGRLRDSESQLNRLRGGGGGVADKLKPIATSTSTGATLIVKTEKPSPSSSPINNSNGSGAKTRPQLVIPPPAPKPQPQPQPPKSNHRHADVKPSIQPQPQPQSTPNASKLKPPKGNTTPPYTPIKRKFEHSNKQQHKELIPLICRSSSPCTIRCTTTMLSSQRKKKLRSIALCPTNDQLFVTSALDGVINLWQIQGKGSGASVLSTSDCVSPKQRRWPEDLTWHPEGNRIISVYTADDGDSQISILNLNKTQERDRVTFLEEKPHVKGIINSVIFMPWDGVCFATGGSDHAVILWHEKDGGGDDSWKPKALHRNQHSSAVMGVAGLQQKQIVLSVGCDKRIIGFDLGAGRASFKHQIDSKCMSVMPNPCDFNLFMVQTGTPERQLRLFDHRLRETEIHAFGWKQESSESQSALINQAWSPDGLYITSGSTDPKIHIFDIRYNSPKPSQSIPAHQMRVFKAVWHYSLPLLISISSDKNVGLHKII